MADELPSVARLPAKGGHRLAATEKSIASKHRSTEIAQRFRKQQEGPSIPRCSTAELRTREKQRPSHGLGERQEEGKRNEISLATYASIASSTFHLDAFKNYK